MPIWIIEDHHSGIRLDVVLAELADTSRAAAQKFIEAGTATVNSRIVKSGYRLIVGDRIDFSLADYAEHPLPAAESIPLNVLFEDEHLLVINKPRGMVVHPAPGNRSGTLVNAVLGLHDDPLPAGDTDRPGIVHRLDKDTSGLIVVARTESALRKLALQFQVKTAERKYDALLWGRPKFMTAEVDAPIGRCPVDRKKMAVLTDDRHRSRSAVTEFTVTEHIGPFARCRARLRTGRTHQIRVHAQFIGHPVVADPVYGGIRQLPNEWGDSSRRKLLQDAMSQLNGQWLHAGSLEFTHPESAERLCFVAPLPIELSQFLAWCYTNWGGGERLACQ